MMNDECVKREEEEGRSAHEEWHNGGGGGHDEATTRQRQQRQEEEAYARGGNRKEEEDHHLFGGRGVGMQATEEDSCTAFKEGERIIIPLLLALSICVASINASMPNSQEGVVATVATYYLQPMLQQISVLHGTPTINHIQEQEDLISTQNDRELFASIMSAQQEIRQQQPEDSNTLKLRKSHSFTALSSTVPAHRYSPLEAADPTGVYSPLKVSLYLHQYSQADMESDNKGGNIIRTTSFVAASEKTVRT